MPSDQEDFQNPNPNLRPNLGGITNIRNHPRNLNRSIATANPSAEKFNKQPQQKRRFPSVQYRLKLNNSNDNIALNGGKAFIQSTQPMPAVVTAARNEKANSKPNSATSVNKLWKFDPNCEPCESIALYCKAREYGEPKYHMFKSKKGRFYCQIIIDTNTIYSTYPQEYTTEANARIACAEKAIQQIKIAETRNPLPTFPDDIEFLNVLYNELLLNPYGIISDKISEWFSNKFRYSVPDHWFVLIKNSARFVLEEGLKESTFIILANKDVSSDTVDDSISEQMAVELKQPELPWSEKNWELFITYCVSSIQIWARLLDDENITRFKTFMAELSTYMSENKVRPDVIAPKHIYAVECNSCWVRVRVESLDKENQKAFCRYIDFGDIECLTFNELYFCDSKFLNVAPQAIPLSLFGLEDFAQHPYAAEHLENRLINRGLIGEIVTSDLAEFEANGVIQVVLFDTSADEDINLNLVLQEEFCKQSLPPQLSPKGAISSVHITNIDGDNGDISLQIINADSQYVNKTLIEIIDSKLNREQFKFSPDELHQWQEVLLVHDHDHHVKWCRARLINSKQAHEFSNSPDQMVDVLYIDYNVERRVYISDIFRLEPLSMGLSKFPPQALRVKLHKIPEFNQMIIGRMRALLPINCQAFVRIEEPGDIPQVTILRRLNGADMPCCNINDDLILEIDYHLNKM